MLLMKCPLLTNSVVIDLFLETLIVYTCLSDRKYIITYERNHLMGVLVASLGDSLTGLLLSYALLYCVASGMADQLRLKFAHVQ